MPAARAHRGVKIAISVGLAAVLLGYFLWRSPLAEMAEQIALVRPGLLLASAATALLSYFLRSLRWGLILAPVGRARVGDLWGCTSAGFAASTILPARAGELVRPVLLSMRARLPVAGTLASIVTERLADLATVIALFGIGVVVAGERVVGGWIGPLRSSAALVGTGLALAFVVAWLLLRFRGAAVARVAALAPHRWRAAVESFVHHLLDGLQVIRSPRRLLELAAWSVVLWLIIGLQVALLAAAFSFSLGFGQVFVLVAVSVLGLAVPTPGGVGGFHAAVQFALHQILGVGLATASAFALVHHAVCFFPITVIGLTYCGVWGLSPARVSSLGEAGADEGAGD